MSCGLRRGRLRTLGAIRERTMLGRAVSWAAKLGPKNYRPSDVLRLLQKLRSRAGLKSAPHRSSNNPKALIAHHALTYHLDDYVGLNHRFAEPKSAKSLFTAPNPRSSPIK